MVRRASATGCEGVSEHRKKDVKKRKRRSKCEVLKFSFFSSPGIPSLKRKDFGADGVSVLGSCGEALSKFDHWWYVRYVWGRVRVGVEPLKISGGLAWFFGGPGPGEGGRRRRGMCGCRWLWLLSWVRGRGNNMGCPCSGGGG